MKITIRRVKSDPSTWDDPQPANDCDNCHRPMNTIYKQKDGRYFCMPCHDAR